MTPLFSDVVEMNLNFMRVFRMQWKWGTATSWLLLKGFSRS